MHKALNDPELLRKIMEKNKLPLDTDDDIEEQIIYENDESLLISPNKVVKLLLKNTTLNFEHVTCPSFYEKETAFLMIA